MIFAFLRYVFDIVLRIVPITLVFYDISAGIHMPISRDFAHKFLIHRDQIECTKSIFYHLGLIFVIFDSRNTHVCKPDGLTWFFDLNRYNNNNNNTTLTQKCFKQKELI